MIHFFLTNRCNLGCDYCYVNEQDAKQYTLDLEFAKLGMDEFFETNSSRWIRFFASGEPTLEFELMKSIHEYARERAGDELKVELQTNGVFSSEVCEWICENVDIAWISHDGPDAHDVHRKTIYGKPSSPIVEQNIRRLVESPVTVGVRPTITEENVQKQREMVRYFTEIGIKAIAADPIFSKVGESSNDPLFLVRFARDYLAAAELASELGIFYTTILTTNFDEKTNIACQACIPCPHLTPDGYVSACDMATRGDTPLQALIYGKYNKNEGRIEYFEDRIKQLRSRTLENIEHCAKCDVGPYCAGTCLGETLNETGSLFGRRMDSMSIGYICSVVRFLDAHSPRTRQIYPYLHP